MTATIIAFKPKARSSEPLSGFDRHDPRRLVLQKHYHSLLGMNQRQEEMARHLSFKASTYDELMDVTVSFLEAQREFSEALEAYREHLLNALATKCPAAAQRIRECKPPRRTIAREKTSLQRAVAFTAEAQLVQIAAADVGEALRTWATFRDGAAAARAVFEVLAEAEMRLLAAIAAVPRDGLART